MSEEEAKKRRKEHEQATKELNDMLHPSRPKNLPQGLTAGIGNIVGGAVGAAGVAVLAPTVGLMYGSKTGGFVGGIVGLTGGLVIGAVGAVGVAVGGVVSGTSNIIRGVMATPQAIMAPRQGKWWNETESAWVYTDLPKDMEKLRGVPVDDSDLLGKVQAEVEKSASNVVAGTSVKETYYYDILDVSPGADQSAIKRRYYTLARTCHPDKVTDEAKKPEAEKKFQEISEAYQVLSDPDLRKRYDEEGREGLSPDKTSEAIPKLDPKILYAFLFGSDKFQDYFGRLATATSASVGDSEQIDIRTARIIQVRRVTRLASKLAGMLQPWVEGKEEESRKDWADKANDLATASYGVELVHLIGRVYHLSAMQFQGTFDSGVGMPSIGKWAKNRRARMKAHRDKANTRFEGFKAGMDLSAAQAELEAEYTKATTDEERDAVAQKMKDNVMHTLLKIMWTTTAVDVTSTIHETVQMVLYDQSVDKDTRKKRGQGLVVLGETFEECKASTADEKKDDKTLYEEAAFAAMLETIKKKEESAFDAASGKTDEAASEQKK